MKLYAVLIALLLIAPIAATEQADCNHITIVMHPTSPPDGTWTFVATGATGPWMLFHGDGYDPTAMPHGHYKGCDFWPFGTLAQLGPFTGDIFATFVPPWGPSITGCWQAISATETSNPVCGP